MENCFEILFINKNGKNKEEMNPNIEKILALNPPIYENILPKVLVYISKTFI